MKKLMLLAFIVCSSVNAAQWNFRAFLDNKPIGTHRFTLNETGEQRVLQSEADFAVKFIGITAYHYHHVATEHWRGECLQELSATTDDDGKLIKVHLDATELPGCQMSFAYWTPSILAQRRLLNAQTDVLENVKVTRGSDSFIEVHGVATAATCWRIVGASKPIDIWYSAQGEWIGLDSTVAGGRKLSYRLE